MNKTLQGLRVLNTRPENQGQTLSERIKAAGGLSINCPALAIVPPDKPWLCKLPPLTDMHYAIFISANAVHFFFQGLKKENLTWPDTLRVIAIGQATAETLKNLSITVDALPEIADSEHLVQLSQFQNIDRKNILLIKGKDGRRLIENTLRQHHAHLFSLEVYQRILPQYDSNQLNSIWQNDAVDIILFTSEQGMMNIFAMFGSKAYQWLCQKPCLVLSQRLANTAKKLGIKQVFISHPTQIIETLCDYKQGTIHGQ